MKYPMVNLLIFFLSIFLLAGCWDRRELDELAIETAEGIDKVGDQYRLTVQAVDPSQVASKAGGAGSRSPVTTYSMNGDTLFEAVRKMSTVTSRQLYGAHLRMVIIGESVARDGISEIIDLFARNHEFRTDFFIAIAKGTTAENVLKIMTPLEKIPASSMFDTLQTSEARWAPTIGIPLHQFIEDLTSEGREPVLTAIEVKGNQAIGEMKKNVEQTAPNTLLQYGGIGLFKDDKLTSWLDPEESKAITYIRNKVKNTIAVISCPNGGKISIEINKATSKIKGSIKNGKPHFEVGIKTEGIIGEVICQIDISNRATINGLTKQSEESLKKMIAASIRKAQKQKADVFGFGEVMYRTNPSYWAKVKDRWDDEFSKAEIHVNVKSKIRSSGTIGNPFKTKGTKKGMELQ